jgi:hypothetical protein
MAAEPARHLGSSTLNPRPSWMRTHHPDRVSPEGEAHLPVQACRRRPNGQVSCTSRPGPPASSGPRSGSPSRADLSLVGHLNLPPHTKPQRVAMAAPVLNSSLRRVDASSWSATGQVSPLWLMRPAGWCCAASLSVLIVGAPPARDSAMPRRVDARGLRVLSGSPQSAASTGCRNVMKATHSRSTSPVPGDVGSPHRSHGWRNEKRSWHLWRTGRRSGAPHRLPGPHHRKSWEVSSTRVMQR